MAPEKKSVLLNWSLFCRRIRFPSCFLRSYSQGFFCLNIAKIIDKNLSLKNFFKKFSSVQKLLAVGYAIVPGLWPIQCCLICHIFLSKTKMFFLLWISFSIFPTVLVFMNIFLRWEMDHHSLGLVLKIFYPQLCLKQLVEFK